MQNQNLFFVFIYINRIAKCIICKIHFSLFTNNIF